MDNCVAKCSKFLQLLQVCYKIKVIRKERFNMIMELTEW